MSKAHRIILIAGNGFDETEVKVPLEFFPSHGIKLDVATAHREPDVVIEGKHGFPLKPTAKIADLNVKDYDAVLLPGGYEGPDRVRGQKKVLEFIRQMNESGKIIGAICHGPWVLISADYLYGKILKGRSATSYPNMHTDLLNAGANVQHKELVIDVNLITADRPERSLAWSEAVLSALNR